MDDVIINNFSRLFSYIKQEAHGNMESICEIGNVSQQSKCSIASGKFGFPL